MRAISGDVPDVPRGVDPQRLDSVALTLRRDEANRVVGKGELPEGVLDADLPSGRGAEQHLIAASATSARARAERSSAPPMTQRNVHVSSRIVTRGAPRKHPAVRPEAARRSTVVR